MSKFNLPNTATTTNRSGYIAYSMSEKEHLVTAVLTTMFGEPKYYGSTDEDIVRLATNCAKSDPAFLAKLAAYARNVGNMRSASHVLTAVIAREAHEFTRDVIKNVVVRPDDITEIMSCYKGLYGKPFPNAMKREMANALQQFDEYQIAKYSGGNKSLKFRDVLRITHPVPKTKEIELLFKKVLDDELGTPYTWEVELSTRGNTKEVWDELISSGKVGYMALLRNLRNIIQSGADVEPVLEKLSDPDQVRKSRQLPFRFYSAYRTLADEKLITPQIHKALEDALVASIDNMDPIPGRTLIAVDDSGSMGARISLKSDVRCCDIASLFGAMSSRLCEDATVCYFDAAFVWWQKPSKSSKGYRIAHYGKYESILDICANNASSGGGTDLSLPMKYALEEDASVCLKPFDRVIYFSDNECNSSYRGLYKTVQGLADTYRSKYNKNFWVHGVDLQGYGSQQFCGNRFNLIAGWGESVLPFINLAEKGISTLVEAIESYDTMLWSKEAAPLQTRHNLLALMQQDL
ncbi:MAG: TROVE domain-containing protein [Coriobacteriales bacterium]|nr:TROVE domain-containing protein [Coriobacteriales bacterium]